MKNVFALGLVIAGFALGADWSGQWRLILKDEDTGIEGRPTLSLTQTGSAVTGTYSGRFGVTKASGSINGRSIVLEVQTPQGMMRMEGNLDESGEKLEGRFAIRDSGSGIFTGTKRAVTPQPSK